MEESKMRKKPLRLAGIAGDSIVDGPGIRTTVFVQGCPHHCQGCQNPETWDFSGGTERTVGDVLEEILSNPLSHAVTFSGGEPFCQAEALTALARLLRESGYEIASFTGYLIEDLLQGTEAQKALLRELDVLIDGPFILGERSLELNFRGSRNQRVLNVPDSLRTGAPVLETSSRWLYGY